MSENKTHYYISANNPKGFEEITEAEHLALFGDETTGPYANSVYQGEMTIDAVPDDLRETVQAIVDAKIAKWGYFHKQEVSAEELKTMIEEAM